MLYLDFKEFNLAIKNFAMFLQSEKASSEKIFNILEKLDYLVLATNKADKAFYSELIVKTNFEKPFFKEFVELIPDFANKNAN